MVLLWFERGWGVDIYVGARVHGCLVKPVGVVPRGRNSSTMSMVSGDCANMVGGRHRIYLLSTWVHVGLLSPTRAAIRYTGAS